MRRGEAKQGRHGEERREAIGKVCDRPLPILEKVTITESRQAGRQVKERQCAAGVSKHAQRIISSVCVKSIFL